jgi:hypothetical protein
MQDVKNSRKINIEELHELWEPNSLGSQNKEGEIGINIVTDCTERNA